MVEPTDKEYIKALLTFDTAPPVYEMIRRAKLLAEIVVNTPHTTAMIGGAPFFMATLEAVLVEHGIRVVYSFSPRVVIDQVQADGTVRKVSDFVHTSWVDGGGRTPVREPGRIC